METTEALGEPHSELVVEGNVCQASGEAALAEQQSAPVA